MIHRAAAHTPIPKLVLLHQKIINQSTLLVFINAAIITAVTVVGIAFSSPV